MALYDAQENLDRTNWSTLRDLSGTATYDGVAYFDVDGPAVPDPQRVRGAMSVDVDFDQNLPVIDGTINKFISEDDQSLKGALTFNVEDSATYIPDPNRSIEFNVDLTGTLQAPGSNSTQNIDARIFGVFAGENGEFLNGAIDDAAGRVQINGGYTVRN